MRVLGKGFTQGKAGVLIGILLLTGTLQAVGITPAWVEVNLDQGRPTGVFYLTNVGTTEERYRISAMSLNYTETGTLIQSQTHSLARWIRFNPREVTIAPGTQRAVRFIIAPNQKLEAGEWWAAMQLESLDVSEFTKKDDKNRTFQLKVISRIVVPIFGTVGKPTYEGQIKDVQVQLENGQTWLKALVAATGTGRLGIARSSYEILDGAGKTVSKGAFAMGYVFRGTQRWFTRKIEDTIPKGQYTVKVSLPADHLAQPLAKETQFTWAGNEAPAVAKPPTPPATKEQQNQEGNKPTEVRETAGSK